MSTTLDPSLDWENLLACHAEISGGQEIPVETGALGAGEKMMTNGPNAYPTALYRHLPSTQVLRLACPVKLEFEF